MALPHTPFTAVRSPEASARHAISPLTYSKMLGVPCSRGQSSSEAHHSRDLPRLLEMHLLDLRVASGQRYHRRTIIGPLDAFRDNQHRARRTPKTNAHVSKEET